MNISRSRKTALVAATLLLAGCSSDTTGEAEGDIPAVDSVEVTTGGDGEEPTLEFTGEPGTELQRSILAQGDGGTVEAGDLLVAQYLGQVHGGDVFDSSYQIGAAGFTIGAGQVIPGWDEALVGLEEGSEVLLSIPPEDGYGETGQPDAGIGPDDTLVFYIEILETYPSGAAGDPDAAVQENPTPYEVEGELGERPSITVPEGVDAPAETMAYVLGEGDGEEVVEGTVILQYEAVTATGEAVESSWEQGAPIAGQISTGGIGPFDQLIGVPIGSRVLVTFVPPVDETIPAEEQVDEPPYVLVVDVLGNIPT